MNIEQERAAFEAACRKHAEESGYDGHERLERNGDGYADPHTQAAWWGWREGLAALQSQDREDAERYRWLRNSAGFLVLPYIDHGGGPEFPSGSELDAAIDHARRVEDKT